MPAKVTLRVTQGKLQGQEFIFEERAVCIVGRDDDCRPKLPKDQDHKTISRHHCLLDINPPDVRVRDFGSLNGTWVNGKKIGQRQKGLSAEEASQNAFPEHDLKDGDDIKLGNTVFRVAVFVPAFCDDCSIEIPEEQKSHCEKSSGVYQCETCRKEAESARLKEAKAARLKEAEAAQLKEAEAARLKEAEAARLKEASKKKAKVCAKCGKDVAKEVGENRQGEFICAACKNDPIHLLELLLGMAKSGDKNLLSIQGYKVLKELGKGGMGAVYLARHEKTGEQVALKVMLPRVALQERSKVMFLRETENTKVLQHRHVVQLRDAGCSQGTFFFTLEFCDGGSVDGLMEQRGGTLSIDEAGQITLQALSGLEYAHQAEIPSVKLADGRIGTGHGLVHRDLKPHNIFLSGSGSARIAKVGDYGLAKAFDTAGLSGHTCADAVMGTPVFMPRQQALDFKFARPEVDVWAKAASLYFMLTGQFPRDFSRGKDPWSVVLGTDPIPIRQRDASIPKKLAEVIDQALVDKPEIHFKSAAEFKKALEKVL